MIAWDKKYELGIESIDEQHKELILIASELSELLENAKHDGHDIYDEIVEVIDRLTNYTVYHFNYEEKLLEKCAYESIDEHMKAHSDFIAQIHSLDLNSVDGDQVSHGVKILKLLISWIFKHISGTDFLYRDLLLGNNVK